MTITPENTNDILINNLNFRLNNLCYSNKIANICKFFFYLSPLGFFHDPEKAKKYYIIWKNL